MNAKRLTRAEDVKAAKVLIAVLETIPPEASSDEAVAVLQAFRETVPSEATTASLIRGAVDALRRLPQADSVGDDRGSTPA